MNLQQLIENSILDAMGLLDDSERDGFEQAFRASSPAIQAQVRREQTRLSRLEALLPDVTPPAGLRAAVIAAVRRQVEAVDSETAGFISPDMIASTRVSPWWRTGALAMAAAAVVLGVTVVRFRAEFNGLEAQVQGDELVASLAKQMGQAYVRDVLFNHDTHRVILASSSPDYNGQASLFMSPEWKGAKFFYNGLRAKNGRVYKLALVDENDRVVDVIATINPEDGLRGMGVAIDPKTRGHVAILTSDDGGHDSVLGRGELPGSL